MIDWTLILPQGYSNEKDMLYDLYIRRNMTQEGLAKFLGIAPVTLNRRLRLHNINKGKGQFHRFKETI